MKTLSVVSGEGRSRDFMEHDQGFEAFPGKGTVVVSSEHVVEEERNGVSDW